MSATQTVDERLQALIASDPDAMRDQDAILAEARETAPVIDLGWVCFVTRHAGVKQVLRDPRGFLNATDGQGTRAALARAQLETADLRRTLDEVFRFESNFITRVDGDVHRRIRRIVQHAFAPKRIAELGEAVDRYCDELLAPLRDGEEADLMPFAYRLPLMIVCDMLGVPHADRELVHDWSLAIGRNRGGLEAGPLIDAHKAEVEFQAYIQEMIDHHRRSPGSGGPLVASLLDAEEEDGITAAELAANVIVILFAGHETTTSLLGGSVLSLLEAPDRWHALVDDPDAIPTAVRELLRFVSPVQWMQRYAPDEIEVEGVTIPAGRTANPCLASANRDPRVFADADAVDLRRSNLRESLGFGIGIHYCLGANLATLEGSIAIRTLTRRFPGLALVEDEAQWAGNPQLRRPASLCVALA